MLQIMHIMQCRYIDHFKLWGGELRFCQHSEGMYPDLIPLILLLIILIIIIIILFIFLELLLKL